MPLLQPPPAIAPPPPLEWHPVNATTWAANDPDGVNSWQVRRNATMRHYRAYRNHGALGEPVASRAEAQALCERARAAQPSLPMDLPLSPEFVSTQASNGDAVGVPADLPGFSFQREAPQDVGCSVSDEVLRQRRPPDPLPDPHRPGGKIRAVDPETSRAAAENPSNYPKWNSMRDRLGDVYSSRGPSDIVLAPVWKDYPHGLTSREAARVAGYDEAKGAWKRVSELKRDGWVEPTGKIRDGQEVLRMNATVQALWQEHQRTRNKKG